ncbi:MAG: NifU family protein [Pseudarcicella sp.]|nr:NifU family protein [Pseudarcicella sp.]MBP6410370.1 NifU family protein [Pseudarcicella sp.]
MENILEHPLLGKIESALNQIRPYLASDGGNVQVVAISEDNVLEIELLGACSSCSMSAMTFKAGIEETIRREVPEIVKVIAVNN